jgi:hypothetical protein
MVGWDRDSRSHDPAGRHWRADPYTMYPAGDPDFPMPQQLQTAPAQQSVVISCLVSDLRFEWRLEPLDGGRATRISVHVDIPPAESHRLETQRHIIEASITRLADVAAR